MYHLADILETQATDRTIKLTEHHTGNRKWRPLKSEWIRPFRANQQENDAVIAFFEGLTDPTFLSDPAYIKPWLEKHPTQGIQR